jgi:TetR/AcrR family transcriptional regulator, regulator of cefoperazone and chloramphenicol sensitivity
MLNMRSVGEQDLTTRARIRDVAIVLFGRDGFGRTAVRSIATAAGVSPALVLHHFGSKEGLREACEDHVGRLLAAEVDRAAASPSNVLAAMLDGRPEFAALSGFLRRSLLDGGDFGHRLFASMVADTRRYLSTAVAQGQARPTDDEDGRALAMVVMSMGVQLLAGYLAPPGTPETEQPLAAGDRLALPLLELLTHGLYTGSELLDGYRAGTADRADRQDR